MTRDVIQPTAPATAAPTASSSPAGDVRWSSARFYWALLDASVLPAHERPTQERLRYLLEPELPEPLEDVHAVFAPIGGTRWLACVLPRRVLASDVLPGTLTLAPSELAPFVHEAVGETVAPGALNLLVGEFEPTPVRAWRRRAFGLAILAAAAVLALVLVGIERRAAAARDGIDHRRAQREELIAAALGPAPAGQPLPPELRLAAALRALRQTRRQGERVVLVPDPTDALLELLRRWPSDLPNRTDAIVVTDASLHVRGTVADSDQAQRLASATAELTGLRAAFPSIQSAPDGVRFGLEWRRDPGAKR